MLISRSVLFQKTKKTKKVG